MLHQKAAKYISLPVNTGHRGASMEQAREAGALDSIVNCLKKASREKAIEPAISGR